MHSRGGIDYDRIVRDKLFSKRDSVDHSIGDTLEDYNFNGNTPIKKDRKFIDKLNQTADRFSSGFKNNRAVSPVPRPQSNVRFTGEKIRSGTAAAGPRQKRPDRFNVGLAIRMQSS